MKDTNITLEISQNSGKSTVRSEINQFRCKMGVGGKCFFSSFSNNQKLFRGFDSCDIALICIRSQFSGLVLSHISHE